MRFKKLDLNLLVTLDVLLEECSVSRAAERLCVSQPAASAALGRLRDYFKDELLVLHGIRMIPTSYAYTLQPKVKKILSEIDQTIAMSVEFDAANSDRTFRFMASDYVTSVLLRPLTTRIKDIAPNVSFDVRFPEDAIRDRFERGEVDLMLVPEEFLSPQHPSQLVFEEEHVIVGWEQNPIFANEVTLEDYNNATHVAVRIGPFSEPTHTERQIEKKGLARKIATFAPNFSVIPGFLVGTNRIALMQQRLANQYSEIMPLKTAPIPFPISTMRVMAQHHSARAEDQGLQWLMKHLIQVAAEQQVSPPS